MLACCDVLRASLSLPASISRTQHQLYSSTMLLRLQADGIGWMYMHAMLSCTHASVQTQARQHHHCHSHSHAPMSCPLALICLVHKCLFGCMALASVDALPVPLRLTCFCTQLPYNPPPSIPAPPSPPAPPPSHAILIQVATLPTVEGMDCEEATVRLWCMHSQ